MTRNLYDSLNDRARFALSAAQKCAAQRRHEVASSEDLVYGLVAEEFGVAAKAFASFKVTANDVLKVLKAINKMDSDNPSDEIRTRSLPANQITFDNWSRNIFERANREAKSQIIGVEHLLLGCFADQAFLSLLSLLQVDPVLLRNKVVELMQSKKALSTNSKGDKTPYLDKFTSDLSVQAQEDKIDPVVGRTKELERLIKILSRATKNNPILIGEPGVGKTALIGGLARQIANDKVPHILRGKRIVLLDLTMLVAGTKFRGEFEERLTNLIAEVEGSKGSVILAIDEVHNLVGAGGAEGSMDASNILKPALARGLQCIGATTIDEYRKRIEKDSALARRFQSILLAPPTVSETIAILKGLKQKFESHHGVIISEVAIVAAAELSERYIIDRFLPDKAIDLIDEACSTVVFDGILEVTETQVAAVVASWTGIPVAKLTQDEADTLLQLPSKLQQRVVGQQVAIDAISNALNRNGAGLRNPSRPIASFIFSGPTGVGKTELAKALAASYFGAEEYMIRIDMSEYMERHNVAKLIGAPPGYLGYDDGGQLTEAVRRRPYTVVLLDEIEKAHPDAFNLFLQILDDGRLTDSKGRVVNFNNTVIIMTTNIGSQEILSRGGVGFELENKEFEKISRKAQQTKDQVQKGLQQFFRPEFLNRVDDIIVFAQLSKEDVRKITYIQLDGVETLLAAKNLTLALGDDVFDYLRNEGFSIQYGARELNRAISRLVLTPLSQAILQGLFKPGDKIFAYMKDGAIVFDAEPILVNLG